MPQDERLVRRWLALAGAIGVGVGVAGLVWIALAGGLRLGPTDWGPLAVAAFETGDQALAHGTLRVTNTCVFLVEAGDRPSILVWAEQRTTWMAGPREIVFENRDGRRVTLQDSQQVTFGGGGDSAAEGGVPGDAWIAASDWVARPDPTCPTDSRWYVGEVVSP